MDFYLEHTPKQRCWKVYDMRKHRQIENPPFIIYISDSQMDRLLMAYCIDQGAIEPCNPNRKGE